MRRTLLLLAAVLLGGCGPAEPEPIRLAERAEPQSHDLRWRELYPGTKERLVFEVHRLEVTAKGWRAEVSVTNETRIPFSTGGPAERQYGLMLFADDDLEALQEASAAGALPPVREARTISPPLPPRLAPGATWRATLSAPGALAAGSVVRVAFGPLIAEGEAPGEMQPVVYWITDRSRRL